MMTVFVCYQLEADRLERDTDAYSQGYHAGEAGERGSTNPYINVGQENNRYAIQWNLGWNMGTCKKRDMAPLRAR
jgi:ribosome modulation factor